VRKLVLGEGLVESLVIDFEAESIRFVRETDLSEVRGGKAVVSA
jgi:hypothetical protein